MPAEREPNSLDVSSRSAASRRLRRREMRWLLGATAAAALIAGAVLVPIFAGDDVPPTAGPRVVESASPPPPAPAPPSRSSEDKKAAENLRRHVDGDKKPATPRPEAERRPPPPEPARAPDAAAAAMPGSEFRDCPDCPPLIVVPGGAFVMGSPAAEPGRTAEEGPQKRVVFARPVALGRTEVTRGQWAAYVRATGARQSGGCWAWTATRPELQKNGGWNEAGFAQTDDHPVVCVQWREIGAYIDWLNARTGRRYRLPSEAEWEYAARAGAAGSRPWADIGETCRHANAADAAARTQFGTWSAVPCDDGQVFTSPAGRLAANAFGLHDMLGNVWEWTQDCWAETLAGGTDGKPRLDGNCDKRAIRGGAWNNDARMIRSAARTWLGVAARSNNVGFRLARDLD